MEDAPPCPCLTHLLPYAHNAKPPPPLSSLAPWLTYPPPAPPLQVVVDKPRVMAAVWGPGDSQPTVLVLLDERGALVDLLPCGQLSGNIPKSGKSFLDVFSDERKRKDVGRIKDKILDKVGGWGGVRGGEGMENGQ